jgi:hypothetical protein
VKRDLFNLDDFSDQDRKNKLTQGHKDAVTIAAKALEKMDEEKYSGTLQYWFGDKHTNDESKEMIRGVFKNFLGKNTDGTGSDINRHTIVYKGDYWVPPKGALGGVGDGTTRFCSLKNSAGKTATAYFKRENGEPGMHYCDKVFDRSNLETLKAGECKLLGDQVSTKKWGKNFIGANVLHETM